MNRWQEKINKEKIWPFSNWNVLCIIINDDKCNALMRIIEAGHGKGINYNASDNKNINFLKRNRFTLVIYDDESKSLALELSQVLNVLCYPFQAIPDYLMQV